MYWYVILNSVLQSDWLNASISLEIHGNRTIGTYFGIATN